MRYNRLIVIRIKISGVLFLTRFIHQDKLSVIIKLYHW